MKLRITSAIVLAGTMLSSFTLFAEETAATIPAAFLGTYNLSYVAESGTGPVSDGATSTIVLMANNQLCVDGSLLSNPILRDGNGAEAIWTDGAGKFEYAFSNLLASFNEVNVAEVVAGSANPVFRGQYRGSKISTDTTCSGSTSSNLSISAEAQNVLDKAEATYPSLFGQGGAIKTTQGYLYRFYADSGIYVGFKDGRVYVVGGPFGNTILDKGPAPGVITALDNAKIKIDAKANGDGSTSIGGSVDTGGSGAWDIAINGTTTTTVFGFATVVKLDNLIVENVDLNNPTSEDEIENLITDSFKDVGSLTDLKVVIVNNSTNHITLDVSFIAKVVQQGVSVDITYDLRFDYTR